MRREVSILLLFSTKRGFPKSSPASFPTPYSCWRGSELPDWRFGERTRSPATPLLPQPGVWSLPAESKCAACSESLCELRFGGLALGTRPCEPQACDHSDLPTDDRSIPYQLSRNKSGIGIFPLLILPPSFLKNFSFYYCCYHEIMYIEQNLPLLV